MKETTDILSVIIAGFALVTSVWSIILSLRTVKKEKRNDFFNRRREILYKIIETRFIYDEINRLKKELISLRIKIAPEDIEINNKLLNEDENKTSDFNVKMLEYNEMIVRNLKEDTPIKVLENSAADAHKMYELSKITRDRIVQVINENNQSNTSNSK